MAPRIINEPIIVHEGINSDPAAFIWRRRLYRIINILSRWHEPSAWWNGEPVRYLVRVSAAGRSGIEGVYELCRNGKDWLLSRLLD